MSSSSSQSCKVTGEDYGNPLLALTLPIMVMMALPVAYVIRTTSLALSRGIILKQILPAVLLICFEVTTSLASFPAAARCKADGVAKSETEPVAYSGVFSLLIQLVDFFLWTVAANTARKLTTTGSGEYCNKNVDILNQQLWDLSGGFFTSRHGNGVLLAFGIGSVGVVFTSLSTSDVVEESGWVAILYVLVPVIIFVSLWQTDLIWQLVFKHAWPSTRTSESEFKGSQQSATIRPTQEEKARVKCYIIRTFVLDLGGVITNVATGNFLMALVYLLDELHEIWHIVQGYWVVQKTRQGRSDAGAPAIELDDTLPRSDDEEECSPSPAIAINDALSPSENENFTSAFEKEGVDCSLPSKTPIGAPILAQTV